MKKFKKEIFNGDLDLYLKQNWLLNKESEIRELFSCCKNDFEKELIYSLLERFNYLSDGQYNILLNKMTRYIVEQSGFSENLFQLTALAYDDEADSSQSMIQTLKGYIQQAEWRNIKTVNTIGGAIKNTKKGRSQIVIVDEFVGSGRTLRTRIKQLNSDLKPIIEVGVEVQYKFCFLVGMKSTIKAIKEEFGVEIFCALELDKGISEYYQKEEVEAKIATMVEIENRNLADKINTKNLGDYSLGYGNAEALYSAEDCFQNTPNSVFPIFWWSEDRKNRKRGTILFRAENGF